MVWRESLRTTLDEEYDHKDQSDIDAATSNHANKHTVQ